MVEVERMVRGKNMLRNESEHRHDSNFSSIPRKVPSVTIGRENCQ